MSSITTPTESLEPDHLRWSRRDWLQYSTSLALGGLTAMNLKPQWVQADGDAKPKAQVAITLDLEMSRNFPTRDALHWDYEKGNLNEPTKQYVTEAARRVKAAGGVLHTFAVGRVFEQEDVSWLEELLRDGHSIGNHTYDHVYLLAKTPAEVQFRFQRAPWLLRGQSVPEAVRENIRLCELAMRQRLGRKPDGFRAPGGFADGLRGRSDVRAMLLEMGYPWVSTLYPAHSNTEPMQKPSVEVVDAIVAAQQAAQPFIYPDGLIEIPMSPISDIGAFRTGQWKLEWFLAAIRESVAWVIDNGAVFDFLCHPSCLYVTDPKFQTIDMICQMVADAPDRAEIVNLGAIAESTQG